MTDQADHFARLDMETDITQHGAVAVTEADPVDVDATGHMINMHRVHGLRHTRDMIQDIEDALGAGGGLLRVRHDAAHRIQAGVEAADIGQEGGKHTHRNVVMRHLPDTEGPQNQQADFGQ